MAHFPPCPLGVLPIVLMRRAGIHPSIPRRCASHSNRRELGARKKSEARAISVRSLFSLINGVDGQNLSAFNLIWRSEGAREQGKRRDVETSRGEGDGVKQTPVLVLVSPSLCCMRVVPALRGEFCSRRERGRGAKGHLWRSSFAPDALRSVRFSLYFFWILASTVIQKVRNRKSIFQIVSLHRAE